MKKYVPSCTLSLPSWVIPGTYEENLKFLNSQKEIEGVELLFFLYDDKIKKELDSHWNKILEFKERFVFTAHLPDKLLPVHEELVARLAPYVRHFVFHPDIKNPSAQAQLIKEWKKHYKSIFLAENTTDGYLDALLPYLNEDADICMDTGHLLISGKNPAAFYTQHRDRIKEIHFHGINLKQAAIDGRLADHRRFYGNEEGFEELVPLLENYSGVLNLELFSWEEIEPCVRILRA